MNKTETLKLNDQQTETVQAAEGQGYGKGGKPRCPDITTLACGEEANGCSGC